MANNDDDYKKGPRLYCNTHDGSRTTTFIKFKREFETGASAHYLNDDDYSIWQVLDDTHQGGNGATAPALPAAGAAGHAAATRKHKKRINVAFERVCSHIDDDRLREMMHALPADDRRAYDAWQLVLRNCDQGTTDLNLQAIEDAFVEASIEKTVGHSLESITKFSKHLASLNARMPAARKWDDDDLARKMLKCIREPESLATQAVTELNAVVGARRFEIAAAGGAPARRDFTALVTHFDSVWRGLFEQGIIRPRPAGVRGAAGALLVEDPNEINAVDEPDADADPHSLRCYGGRLEGDGKNWSTRDVTSETQP